MAIVTALSVTDASIGAQCDLRLRRSGEFMALQYAPRVNGSSTWQLYPEFIAVTDWPRERWTHIRLEVRGSMMEVVFVNGDLVYSGINGWDSRSPALASFVDARWESVALPFKAGENEVVLAVADDQRFGWGFAIRIGESAGIKF